MPCYPRLSLIVTSASLYNIDTTPCTSQRVRVRHTTSWREDEEAAHLIEDAQALEEAGCFAIVLEKIPNVLAKKVALNLKLPIIGIGAGSDVDGQVLVSHDMLGMNKDFSPRFLRRYLDLDSLVSNAVKKYSSDIKSGSFPNKDEQY